MPKGSFFEYTQSASRSIRYRYVCEQCGFITDWISAQIIQGAKKVQQTKGIRISSQKPSSDPLSIQSNLQARADKTLTEALTILKASISAESDELIIPNIFLAQIFNEEFSAGASCPKCGFRQTWYPAISEKVSISQSMKSYAIGFGVLGTIIAGLTGWIFLSAPLHYSIYICAVTIIAVLFGTLFGRLKAKRLIRQRDQHFASVTERHRPEVDWGDI